MLNPQLPQRVPFIGPPNAAIGAPVDVVERFAVSIREWADNPAPESFRCRGVEPSGIGRTNLEAQ